MNLGKEVRSTSTTSTKDAPGTPHHTVRSVGLSSHDPVIQRRKPQSKGFSDLSKVRE